MKNSDVIEVLEMIRDWPDESAEAMGYDVVYHAMKTMAKVVLENPFTEKG